MQALPDTVAELQRLLIERDVALAAHEALLAEREAALAAANDRLRDRDALIAALKLQIDTLKRQRFGHTSERLEREILQLELELGKLEGAVPVPMPAGTGREPGKVKGHPVRKPLPGHLPREDAVHAVAECCATCGDVLVRMGEDVTEVLEYEPAHFNVIRHVRPKCTCRTCGTLIQAPAPERPIAGGLAGPGLLAHVIVSKYLDHLPLYRQSEIYARDGVELVRSTLTGWVAGSATLFRPLVDAVGVYVLGADKLHADDTPVPVLDPGRGKTRSGRLWVYVRDDRPAGSADPPAVWFRYSPDRKGERPRRHLCAFKGILQADGYAGFNGLYDRASDPLTEAACMAHVRRKFNDLYQANGSPVVLGILERIGELYDLERMIRGQLPVMREAFRREHAAPRLQALKDELLRRRTETSAKSALAGAIAYALNI